MTSTKGRGMAQRSQDYSRKVGRAMIAADNRATYARAVADLLLQAFNGLDGGRA